MNDVFSFAGETLSSADLAALRTLAGILNTVQHAVAEEWSRRLIEVQPEYFAHGVVSTQQLSEVNEAFLALVLSQVERGDLVGLYRAYYESTRQLLEADLQRAPSRPISLVGMHTSACISLNVIQEYLGPENDRLMVAYTKLSIQLMMLVGQAYTDTREAYLQRTFEQINTVSHELRTPLAHLFSYLELLRAGEFGRVSPAQERVLGELIHEADEILLLLTGTLDLSRLDTGRVVVRTEELRLASLFEELVNSTPLDSVAVTWSVAPDVPVLRTDRVKLKQIVGNLLRNALRYGDGAPVTIGARMARPDFVELAVRDHGPGIRPEDLHVIFEFFERGNAAGMARDGYGIGLHVVRRLSGLLSGTIQVESVPGQGACFRVTLPVRLPAAPVVVGGRG
jgi:signal transduction histidine kinase